MQLKSRFPLWYFRRFRYSSQRPFPVFVGVHNRFEAAQGLPLKGAAVADNIHMADTDRDLPKHVRNGFMRYRDFQPLTQGGEALLRTCLDENLGRTVVMKTLLPQFQNLETYQKRFLREARVTAQIPHPCTIPVYELSRDAEGNAYFTMKRLRGRDLSEILDRIAEGDPEFTSRYPLQTIINALLHCAQCLAFAHNQGVVHRDMKPANIMIGDYGEIMVMDWGLAKVSTMQDNDEVDQLLRSGQQNIPGRLTNRGDVQGTPFYMSPEQAVETGDVDERSDIFNMGIILFEVLTSESYISGRNFREIRRRLQEDPVRSPRSTAPKKQIPPELDAICVKALQKNPADRYQRMADFENDLRAWLCGTPVSVYTPSVVDRLLKWRNHKVLCSASLLWMLIGAGLCIAIQVAVGLLG
jgi:serine/threonine protein kinase